MVKLPDFTALGPPKVRDETSEYRIVARQIEGAIEPARGLPDFIAGNYNKKAGEVGEGLQRLGSGIASFGGAIGSALAQQKSAQDKLEFANADANWTINQANFTDAAKKETDEAALRDRYPGELQKAFEQSANSIRDEDIRKHWIARTSPELKPGENCPIPGTRRTFRSLRTS